MIFEWLLSFVSYITNYIFSIFDGLPQVPVQIVSVVDNFYSLVRNALNLLAVFVSFNVLRVIIPIVIVIINLENLYSLVMWILRKIPFVAIE